MPELNPEVFRVVMARIVAEAAARAQASMNAIALAIERQAKINASSGEHKRGTPTPARPGSGPARISGTLVRSIITGDLMAIPGGWSIRVGLAKGLTPPYGRRKTPANKYGMYLDKGMLRNGAAYPFLTPAVRFGVHIVAPTVLRTAFSAPW